jgi:ABC-type uncharacterized transport system ATPase subunit
MNRNNAWQKKVNSKKEAVKEETSMAQSQSLTFHPKINFISQCLHEQKLLLLSNNSSGLATEIAELSDL